MTRFESLNAYNYATEADFFVKNSSHCSIFASSFYADVEAITENSRRRSQIYGEVRKSNQKS
jgi:hypothetical protein